MYQEDTMLNSGYKVEEKTLPPVIKKFYFLEYSWKLVKQTEWANSGFFPTTVHSLFLQYSK